MRPLPQLLALVREANPIIERQTEALRAALQRVGEAPRTAGTRVARLGKLDALRYGTPAHVNKVTADVLKEVTSAAEARAGIAYYHLLKGLPKFKVDVEDTLAAQRRDVSLTWPDSFKDHTNQDMTQVASYREQRRVFIDQSGPADLT